MANVQQAIRTIVVTGDVTADWNIARIRRGMTVGQEWNAEDTSRACLQPGGAAMLGDLIKAMAARMVAAPQVVASSLPAGLTDPADRRVHHSYAMWAPYPYSEKQRNRLVWRVEQFLGIDAACGGDSPDSCRTAPLEDDPATADLVVIDDAALGLRSREDLWPQSIKGGNKPRWIVAKAASPVADDSPGELWHHLVTEHADRTIVMTTINDLRRTSIHASRELSWERVAQDLYWELTHNPSVTSLSSCAHVIVSMGTAGALLLSRMPSGTTAPVWDCRLVFDPGVFEGTWGREHPGSMVGYTVCLAAAITKELVDNHASPDLVRGIRSGIAAMRLLHMEGYGTQDMSSPLSAPVFPAQILADNLGKEAHLAVADVPDPAICLQSGGLAVGSGSAYWTVLDDSCSASGGGVAAKRPTLSETAERIVLEGYESALHDIPLGRFGKLATADRREIEGYRSIRALIDQYRRDPKERPLCIAVFGPPGAGKSFGVKQVAQSVAAGSIQDCTFNISQFGEPSELVDALHQVRDIGLSGKLPLVFWDEFDTEYGGNQCGWLRYLLAPMQDGVFQDGQITHHIGRAVFVFAGGTCSTMAEFDKGRGDAQFRRVKGPDFVSRLHGYLNVIGPNKLDGSVAVDDSHYIIRRAMLLRGLLSRTAPALLHANRVNIDRGVLHAFLHVSDYKHGVRSMESIITSSLLAGRTSYEKSCLPSEVQLDTHVNGVEFLALAQEPVLEGKLLDTMAAGVHQAYRLSAASWTTAAATQTYEALSEDLKEENRRNVRHIAEKLRAIGYVMVPARAGQATAALSKDDAEKLAEMEHWRWVRSKVSDGWVYDPVRSDPERKHPCILPWRGMTDAEWGSLEPGLIPVMGRDALPEVEKEKDRVVVRAIPNILAMAGYTIAKIR